MRCWQCGSGLSVREYAWAHRHEPPPKVKRAAKLLMCAGAIDALSGLLVVTGLVKM